MRKLLKILCMAVFITSVLTLSVHAELNSYTSYTAQSGEKISSLGFAYYCVENESEGTKIVIDAFGQELFDASNYSSISALSEDGLFVVSDDDNFKALVDKDGTELTGFDYKMIKSFSGDLSVVQSKDDESYGYIDKDGLEVIPCIYNTADDFSGGMAKVKIYDKENYYAQSAYIDENGTVKVTLPKNDGYSSVDGSSFNDDGKAFYPVDNIIYVIDTDGNEINNITLSEAKQFNGTYDVGFSTSFKDNYIIYSVRNSEGNMIWGVMNDNGDRIINPEYSDINYIGNGNFIVVNSTGECEIFDSNGQSTGISASQFVYSEKNGYYYTYEGDSGYVLMDDTFTPLSLENKIADVYIDDEKINLLCENGEEQYVVLYSENEIVSPNEETTNEETTTEETTTTEKTTVEKTTKDVAESVENTQEENGNSTIIVVVVVVLLLFAILCAIVIILLTRYQSGKTLPVGIKNIFDKIFKDKNE